MDAHVEAYVKKCRGCMLVAAPAAPEPMRRRELPSEPWQHIATDYLGPLPSGHSLLVVVDYYSRYVEIEIMTKTDSTETIKRLSIIFARFGLPISITADNGRQFVSEEFRNYCETYNMQLVSTTPYWPQMNGEVERQNRSILKRLVISQTNQTDWRSELNKYLLMYRSTPHSTTQKTPAQMMFGRNIRDQIPNIHQSREIDEETADKDKEKKEKERLYADDRRNAKESSIGKGDEVLVKRMIKTNKLSSNFEPETYKVMERKGGEVIVAAEESGKQYRRHVSHLQKIGEGAEATKHDDVNSSIGGKDESTTAEGTKQPKTIQPHKRSAPDTANFEPRVTRSSKRPKDLVV